MRKLTKGKLFIYAMSGLGPNLLMTLVTGYLNDALLAPTGIDPAKTFTGSVIVSVALCSVLFFAAKVIDAFIDVPLAYLSDKMHCKMGRRKASILMGWVPMVISFLLLWAPKLYMGAGATGITWIQAILLVIFYSSYTLTLVAYYGSYSAITKDEQDLSSLTHYKAFFDTIQYCVSYALFPSLLLGILGGHEAGAISKALLMLAPMMLTMLIPMFMIKDEDKEEEAEKRERNVPLMESIRASASSRPFRRWLGTQFLIHVSLMLFLTGIGTTIPDNLVGIKGWQVTIMNSAAFAPVPLMLLIFNGFKKRKGHRFALQTALIAFAVAMFIFASGWKQLWQSMPMISFIIGLIASTIGSYSVGVFFSISYFYPAHIATEEMKVTGKDNAAMYFAIQGLVTQLASAVGVNLIYINLVGNEIPIAGMQGGQFVLVPIIAGVVMLAAFFVAFGIKRNIIKE